MCDKKYDGLKSTNNLKRNSVDEGPENLDVCKKPEYMECFFSSRYKGRCGSPSKVSKADGGCPFREEPDPAVTGCLKEDKIMLKEHSKKLTKKDGVVAMEKGTVVTSIVMCGDGSIIVRYVRCPKLAKMARELGISDT